jgi:PilZ domain-containing protein
MLQDRRKTPRRAFKRITRFNNDLTGPRECMVIDLSDQGARLHSDETPPAFTLTVSGDKGDERRACRVVWRPGHEVFRPRGSCR